MNDDIFRAEFDRAMVKYPPELWAKLSPQEMQEALLREVDELEAAIRNKDLNGEHGITRECAHVQVVAQRIQDEMRRRTTD